MVRRIAGQCNHVDFASIEHLVEIIESPEMLDVTTLTSSQKYAFHFTAIATRKGIPWKLIRQVVKEVLFWNEGGVTSRIEIKFMQGRPDVSKFRELWRQK